MRWWEEREGGEDREKRKYRKEGGENGRHGVKEREVGGEGRGYR